MLTARIESTTLAQAAYDETSGILCLEFRSGAVYAYLDVPDTVYHQLIQASSKGRFFNQRIRGRFRFLRLSIAPSRD